MISSCETVICIWVNRQMETDTWMQCFLHGFSQKKQWLIDVCFSDFKFRMCCGVKAVNDPLKRRKLLWSHYSLFLSSTPVPVPLPLDPSFPWPCVDSPPPFSSSFACWIKGGNSSWAASERLDNLSEVTRSSGRLTLSFSLRFLLFLIPYQRFISPPTPQANQSETTTRAHVGITHRMWKKRHTHPRTVLSLSNKLQ